MYQKQDVQAAHTISPEKTYGTLLKTALVGGALVSLFALFPPTTITAFWPFIETQAAEETRSAVVHDYSMTLLKPAENPDPNPNKGAAELVVSGGSALVANVGPEGKAVAYTENSSNAGQISLHVVREGESLSVIASLYQVSVNTILWANDIKDASTIQPGDTLLILPVSGIQHTITKGETLASIAKKYSADAEEIAAFNGLEEGIALASGDTLIIPGGDLAPKKATTSTKSGGTTKTASVAAPTLSGYFSNPVPGARLTQGIHGYNGVDLGAPSGTPVYAAASGSIIVAKGGGGYNGGYGNYIVISHANGTQTLYAHLSSLAVSGGAVAQGDLIGYVGNTGRSTGFHLHFEVRGATNPFAR